MNLVRFVPLQTVAVLPAVMDPKNVKLAVVAPPWSKGMLKFVLYLRV